jgi:hypothetical protein
MMRDGAFRLQQAASALGKPLEPCSGAMKNTQGLLCQHDFAQLLAPGSLHPLVNPATIHPFWHLRSQWELQEEAKVFATQWAERTLASGTFYDHYDEIDLIPLPRLQADIGMVPQNEYLLDGAGISREMDPDARIIQEPLNRPQLVRQREKRLAKERTVQEIRNNLGAAEDIVVNLTATNRLETRHETVKRRMKATELAAKKAAKAAKPCKHCKKPGHTMSKCPYYADSQATDILRAQGSQVSLPAPNTARLPPPSTLPGFMAPSMQMPPSSSQVPPPHITPMSRGPFDRSAPVLHSGNFNYGGFPSIFSNATPSSSSLPGLAPASQNGYYQSQYNNSAKGPLW